MVTESADKKSRIIERLATGQEAFLAAVALLGEDELQRPVWTDGGHWTAQQLVAHVALAEDSMRSLIAATLAGTPPQPIPDFDIDRFNEGRLRRAAGTALADLLTHLTESREATLQLLDQVGDNDLDLPTYHPIVKETTVGGIFRVIGFHERMHAKDLRALHERTTSA